MEAPFHDFVLKVHSRCNLACDYCYVYTLADQSWRDQPVVMSSDVAARAARRIAEHLRDHAVPAASVTLHGGEPLLAGPDRLAEIVALIRAAVPPPTRLTFAVQTNGTLLDDTFLELFRRQDIRVGISLDGDQVATDRHRRLAGGGSSYRQVVAGLRRLREPANRYLFAGLLCVIDLRNDPVATYEELVSHEPPRLDFLLPNGNWTAPPPGRGPDTDATPYGDWLCAVFDHWYAAPRRTPVRLFDEIVHLLLGGASQIETVGLSPSATVVIETDGTIEGPDSLKSSYHRAAATGVSVLDRPLDDVLSLPLFRAQRSGRAGLPAECRGCPVGAVCGGGLPAHRYRHPVGFDNPSVYCADLRRLILHIRSRVTADLAAAAR
jgi:uncharacterized protein